MALSAGTRLGPYEVLAPLAAGGMGEVYRARDTRLDRTVAIKVLPSDLAVDPERRARFEREAKAVAALDHPHICGIHDIGEADGTHFLVMPHLEGQTLAARLEKGALPLDQALRVAAEMADALASAHRQGVVHRDVKPANIMLTKTGAKLLDFGLAKLRAPAGPISLSGMTELVTLSPGTAEGVILGTVLYMAPEQVEGKDADARSDIWALGVVIYEMVTGSRPFQGETAASVIGSILKDTPAPVSHRQPLSPPALDHLVTGCLTKDVDERRQSAADVRRDLQWMAQLVSDEASASGRARARGWAAAALSAIAGIVVTAAVLLRPGTATVPAAPAAPVMFTVTAPPGREFVGSLGSVPVPQFAVSPDGRYLAFIAGGPRGRPSLWLRRLDAVEPEALEGTDDAEAPFWAPDGRTIGYFTLGAVRRKDLTSGAPGEFVTKSSVDIRGGAWSDLGPIVFSPTGTAGMRVVPAGGGASTLLEFPDLPPGGQPGPAVAATPAPGLFDTARWPWFMSTSARLLFMVRHADPNLKGIYVSRFPAVDAPRRIMDSDFLAQFSSGHLLTLRGTALVAQPFDPESGRISGTPITIAQPVAGSTTGNAAFSVSTNGVLAYSQGLGFQTELWRVDRSGKRVARLTSAADYIDLAPSPDGKRLAFSRPAEQFQAPDLWVKDLERGTESRLTSDPLTEVSPLWSARGDRLVFRANRQAANVTVWRMEPNAGAQPEEIFSADDQRRAHGDAAFNIFSTDWTNDGKYILYHRPDAEGGFDVWALSLEGDRAVIPVARGPYNELQADVSPDSRWVAYASSESGRYEVYVQPFPDAGSGAKTTVSAGGGQQPRWSADGRELYYLRPDGALMAVDVRSGESRLAIGIARALFDTNLPTAVNPYRTDYAVVPDGTGFVIKVVAEGNRPPAITVVLNWPALLQPR